MTNEQMADRFELAAKIEKEKLEWQFQYSGNAEWLDGHTRSTTTLWALWYNHNIRIKPLKFPDPPEGRKWHNPENLTPEQVEINKGWRLCLKGEWRMLGMEFLDESESCWRILDRLGFESSKTLYPSVTYRTKSPLPDSEKPEPEEWIPLGPEDLPPGTVFRWPHWTPDVYKTHHEIDEDGVYFHSSTESGDDVSFEGLMSYGVLINRSIPETGKWDPAAWVSAKKLKA